MRADTYLEPVIQPLQHMCSPVPAPCLWLTLGLRVLLDMCRMALYKVTAQYGEQRVSVADFSTSSTTRLTLAVGSERPKVASVHACLCYACTLVEVSAYASLAVRRV